MIKRIFVFLLLALPAWGQTFSGQSGDTIRVVPPFKFCLGADNGKDACFIQSEANTTKLAGFLDFTLLPKTVAMLPPASSNLGRVYRVTDGNAAGDCTTGGGSSTTICVSDGTNWVGSGGGGGGGPITIPNPARLPGTVLYNPDPLALYQGDGTTDQFDDVLGVPCWIAGSLGSNVCQNFFFVRPGQITVDGSIYAYNLANGDFEVPANVSITSAGNLTVASCTGCGAATTLWSSLTAPTGAGNFPLAMGANTSIFTTTTALAQMFAFKNTTPATSGASQGSPFIATCGRAWHGGANVEDCLTFSELPGTGNDAPISLNIGHTGTSTGMVTTTFPGNIFLPGATSGGTTFAAAPSGGGTLTAPAGSGTICTTANCGTFGVEAMSGTTPTPQCGGTDLHRETLSADTTVGAPAGCIDGQDIDFEITQNNFALAWDATYIGFPTAQAQTATCEVKGKWNTAASKVYAYTTMACALPPTGVDGVTQFRTTTPLAGVAQVETYAVPGVPTNAQVGTNYPVIATDRFKHVTFNNAAAVAVALPQAGSTGFGSNFAFTACDIGAGTATITPTVSTISYTTGIAYTSGASTLPLTTGQCAWIYSDNTNYFATLLTSIGGGGGGGNVSTTPVGSQAIVQPPGTSTSTNNFAGTRYITATGFPYAWSVSSGVTLTGGVQATVSITCPTFGVFAATDTTSFFQIAGGTTEYVNLQGGTCAPGTTSGTVTFTPAFSHSPGWTIGTASQGLQEALIDAATNGAVTCTPWPTCLKSNWKLIVGATNPPATSYFTILARVTVPGVSNGEIDGKGAQLDCEALESCFYLAVNSASIYLHGFRVSTKLTTGAAKITLADCGTTLTNTATITSTLNPGVGNWVDIQNTDLTKYWGLHQVTASTSSTFQYADSTCNGGGILGSVATPGGAAFPRAVIRDAGSGNRFSDIILDTPSGFTANALNHLIIVENDQHFNADNINANGTGVRCDASYCGDIIYNPGTFASNPAVIHVRDSQLSMQCSGNGITAHGGNTLDVTDSVIQGFSQYGIQSFGVGGFGPAMTNNVYEETGTCSNPSYTDAGLAAGVAARGMAGAVATRSLTTNAAIGSSGGLIGQEPTFCTAGGTVEEYWVVIHDGGTSAAQTTVPLRFGQGNTSCGNTLIGWPHYASPTGSAVTYDILKTQGTSYTLTAPLADGVNHSIALSTAVAQCTGLICTMTDTHPALSAYSTITDPQLTPDLPFWPGGAVLSSGSLLYANDLPITNISSIIATAQNVPTVFANRCGVATPGIYVSCLAGNSVGNNNAPVGATLFQNGPRAGGQTANLKGRINLFTGMAPSLNTGHLFTLVDSNAAKTWADANHRPTNDANDTFIGLDSGSVTPASAQLSFGSPLSISNYIANVGDGASWKERLTASAKTFKVPITATDTSTNAAIATKNTTPAVIGLSQGSPTLSACGRAFHASANVEDCMNFSELPGNGNDAPIAFNLTHTGSSTGVVTTNFPGPITVTSCTGCGSTSSTAWSSLAAPTGAGNFPLAMGTNTSIFTTTTALAQMFAFKNTTAAVVGTSQGSPIISTCGRAFHASGDVEDCLTFSELPGNGNDAAITFNIAHTGTSTGAVTTQFPGPLAAGSSGTVGTLSLGNATSGTVTLGTVSGALGSVTASLPANTGTVSETNLAETFSAVKTFSSAPVISTITNTGTLTLPTATGTLADVIAKGTSALGTGAISSATCATVVTTSATGTATTDVVRAGFNGDPTAVTGYIPSTSGMLTIIAYPTANNVNFKVCNNTSSSITPGAITLNWQVIR